MPNYLERKVDQVQSIVKFFEDPCQAPWSVYLELALAPAGHVALELLSFGLDDVIRGYFRPRGIYRRGRTGILARKFGKYAGIPELGEMLGSHLPGAETVKGRVVSHGVKVMWIVDGVLQRILFWWMVADLLTDFLYEWTSAINKTEYCQSRCRGGVTCEVLPNTLVPDFWSTIGPNLRKCEKSWGDLEMHEGYNPVFATGGWTAASLTIVPFIGTCGGALVRVVDGAGHVYDQTQTRLNPDGTHTAICSTQVPRHTFTWVEAKAVGIRPPCTAMSVVGGHICGWAY